MAQYDRPQDMMNDKPLISPYSGALVRPRRITIHQNGQEVIKLQWVCPQTHQVFRQGILSSTQINKPE